MGCFRGLGTLGNLTRRCLSLGLWGRGGTDAQSGVGQAGRGSGAGSGHIGEAGVLGLTAADDAE